MIDGRLRPSHPFKRIIRAIGRLRHFIVTIVISYCFEISIGQQTRFPEYLWCLHFGKGHFCFAVSICFRFIDHTGVLGGIVLIDGWRTRGLSTGGMIRGGVERGVLTGCMVKACCKKYCLGVLTSVY